MCLARLDITDSNKTTRTPRWVYAEAMRLRSGPLQVLVPGILFSFS